MKLPCFHLWPKSFFGKTVGNTADGTAYYLLLLTQAWMLGGSLPNDDDKLRLMTKLSGHRWRAIRDEILAFWFVGEDGRLHNKRLDEEWGKAARGHRKKGETDEECVKRATKIFAGHDGKLSRKIKEKRPALARTRDPLPLREELSASSRESSSLAAQSLSEPAAALSVGHAAQPAPDTSPTPTNGADPMPATPEEAARVSNLFQAFAAELRAKTQPPPPTPAAQGATSEERDRNAALERLEELKGTTLPPLSNAAKEAAGIPPKRGDDKAWTTDDQPTKRKLG